MELCMVYVFFLYLGVLFEIRIHFFHNKKVNKMWLLDQSIKLPWKKTYLKSRLQKNDWMRALPFLLLCFWKNTSFFKKCRDSCYSYCLCPLWLEKWNECFVYCIKYAPFLLTLPYNIKFLSSLTSHHFGPTSPASPPFLIRTVSAQAQTLLL